MSKSALILSSAKRAKELAQEKFKAQDIQAAIKYATMAKQLNPILDDDIDAYLAAYNIHMVASTKLFNGVTDWYKVLHVTNVFADSDTIKRQYTKLVNMLHPIIKNGSVEAEGALELITRAWKVLSNPKNRRVFDHGLAHRSCFDHARRHAASHAHALHKSSNAQLLLQGKSGDSSFSHGEAPRMTRMTSKKSAAAGTGHHAKSVVSKIEKRTCPKCSRWCKYEKDKFSLITCPSCKKKFDVKASSSAEEVWNSMPRIKPNARFPMASS